MVFDSNLAPEAPRGVGGQSPCWCCLTYTVNSTTTTTTNTNTTNNTTSIYPALATTYCYPRSRALSQHSLGGNARTALVVTLAPGGDEAGENLSTLQFAQRAGAR